jgi:hypothetical protein
MRTKLMIWAGLLLLAPYTGWASGDQDLSKRKPLTINGNAGISANYQITQVGRTGFDVKLEIGNFRNTLNFRYFHAADDSGSIEGIATSFLAPEENEVIGTGFRMKLLKPLSLTGSVAINGFSRSLIKWAGESAISAEFKNGNMEMKYKVVQPGFQSLGVLDALDDEETISLSGFALLANGRVTINSGISRQHQGFSKTQPFRYYNHSGNIQVNASLSDRINVGLEISGRSTAQENGTMELCDSLLLHHCQGLLLVTPGYSYTSGLNNHSFNGSFQIEMSNDNGSFTGNSNRNINLSGSVAYGRMMIEKGTSFSVNASYNQWIQNDQVRQSMGGTASVGIKILKRKDLGLTGTIGYKYHVKSFGKNGSEFTAGGIIHYVAGKNDLQLFFNCNSQTPGGINDALYDESQIKRLTSFAGEISFSRRF